MGVLEGEGAAVVAEGVLAEEAGDDLELFLDQVDALLRVREREAVGGVLGGEPAGADAQLGSTVAHVVERGGHLGQDGRVAKRHRADQGAESNAPRVAGKGGQVDPGVAGHA